MIHNFHIIYNTLPLLVHQNIVQALFSVSCGKTIISHGGIP